MQIVKRVMESELFLLTIQMNLTWLKTLLRLLKHQHSVVMKKEKQEEEHVHVILNCQKDTIHVTKNIWKIVVRVTTKKLLTINLVVLVIIMLNQEHLQRWITNTLETVFQTHRDLVIQLFINQVIHSLLHKVPYQVVQDCWS